MCAPARGRPEAHTTRGGSYGGRPGRIPPGVAPGGASAARDAPRDAGGTPAPLQKRLCNADGPSQRRALALRLFELLARIGVIDDSRTGLHVRAVFRQHDRADGDAGVEVAVEGEVRDRTGVGPTTRFLEAIDQFHGPDLRRAAHGAGGKTGQKRVEWRAVLAQRRVDIGDEMHDVAVAFDVAEVPDFDGATRRDTAEIVASEVDQHEVLCVFL